MQIIILLLINEAKTDKFVNSGSAKSTNEPNKN